MSAKSVGNSVEFRFRARDPGEAMELAFKALQRIAADYEVTPTGHRNRIARVKAINIAREACEALGIDYSAKAVR